MQHPPGRVRDHHAARSRTKVRQPCSLPRLVAGLLTFLASPHSEQSEERWKCLVCEFTNSLEKRNCILCGTKRNSSRRGEPTRSFPLFRGLYTDDGSELPPSADSVVGDLEIHVKKSHTQSSLSGLSVSRQSLQGLRLSTLNTRQRYARYAFGAFPLPMCRHHLL